jgi:tetratricopeptide (TPR) repeat protein
LTDGNECATLLTDLLMTRSCALVVSLSARLLFVQFFLAGLLTTAAIAQGVQQRDPVDDPRRLETYTSYVTAPGTAVLIFTVHAERTGTHLDRQALLKLVDLTNHSVTWRTTEDTSLGVFTNVAYGNYEVEVSAVGYLSTRKEIQVTNTISAAQNDIILHRDPEAINLDIGKAVLPPKARKETKRAVSALKSGNLKEAQKQLDEAYKSFPSSSELNFLLGYLYFQKKDFAQAGTYLSAAANLNPHNAQALTLLGRTGLERQDYPAARSALEQAVMADAENWLPHNLLADTYLHQQNYDKARDEAQVAIAKGKNTASPAQLVLGQALVNMGHDQEAIRALNVFLQESPRHPMAGQVRTLIAEIQVHQAGPVSSDNTSIAEARLSGVDPLAALPAPGFSMKSWKPPGIDDVKPALAPGVMCPSAKVMEESGKSVQELVQDVARFAAVEDLFHQSLDQFGIPVRTETRKYNYVASISQPQPGFLTVDEYRADKLTLTGYPDQIASTGFAALALVFHPDMRDNFDMSCEGLGDWHGQATWLVHFRQRDDRPNRMHSYKVGNQMHPVPLKGRAWITADKFQIVRMEAEMVNPMPEIRLLSEHQAVEYGPVPFLKKNTSLWLPKSAELYFDFRKHRYYRRHSFDHYMLYSVDTEEKRKEPVSKPENK